MISNFIVTIIILIICIYICHVVKEKSIVYTIVVSIIATIIANAILPSTEPILDYINKKINGNKVEASNKGEGEDIVGNANKSTAHIHAEYQTLNENEISADCTNGGSYDAVVYCVCGKELRRETINLEPLGHDYQDGICLRCKYQDPNYVKEYTSKEIMNILSNSVVSANYEFYSEYIDNTISVFAKDKRNCFAVNTAVSYNMWGNNVQTVTFNISDLNKFKKLNFKMGGETGCSGSMYVEIFIDKLFKDEPDYIYELDASAIPTKASIKIKKAKSLGIRVTNNTSNNNTVVFYNFSEGK